MLRRKKPKPPPARSLGLDESSSDKLAVDEDEALVLDSKEKLEHDTEIQANITTVLAVLTKNRLDCPDLGTLRIKDQTLPSESVEKVVAWALSHHLMNCSQPTVKDGKRVISAESITYGLQMLLGYQNENKSVKKSLKDVVTDNDSEKKLLSDVIPSSVDDIVKDKLLMRPLQRPELIDKGQLTEPTKGISLFGPLKDENLKGQGVTCAAASSSASSSLQSANRGPVGYQGKFSSCMDDEDVADESVPDEKSKAAKKDVLDELLSRMRSSQHKAAVWSKVVPPGRSKCVDLDIGSLLLINSIRIVDKECAEFNLYLGNEAKRFYGFKQEVACQLYLIINHGPEEVIGSLTSAQPCLPFIPPLIVDSKFTINHDGHFAVQFDGEVLSRVTPLQKKRRTRTALAREEAERNERGSKEAQRRRAELHNLNNREWPLGVDLTAKVFSRLDDIVGVAELEKVCKLFYRAGHIPVSYRNMNLSNLGFEDSDDNTAHMFMRRSHGQLKSLVLGCNDLLGLDLVNFSDRVLDPLQNSSIGIYMTKLKLTDIPVSEDDLYRVLLQCSSLTDLELHSLTCCAEVNGSLQMVHSCCSLLESFAFTSLDYATSEECTLDDLTLTEFMVNLPNIEHMSLQGVYITDEQLERMNEGWRLKSLNVTPPLLDEA